MLLWCAGLFANNDPPPPGGGLTADSSIVTVDTILDTADET